MEQGANLCIHNAGTSKFLEPHKCHSLKNRETLSYSNVQKFQKSMKFLIYFSIWAKHVRLYKRFFQIFLDVRLYFDSLKADMEILQAGNRSKKIGDLGHV